MYIEIGGLVFIILLTALAVYLIMNYVKNEEMRKFKQENSNNKKEEMPDIKDIKINIPIEPELQDSVALLKRLMDERNLPYNDDSDIVWFFDEDLPLKKLTKEYTNKVIDNYLEEIKKNAK